MVGDIQAIFRDQTILDGGHFFGQNGIEVAVGVHIHQALHHHFTDLIGCVLGGDEGVEDIRFLVEAIDDGLGFGRLGRCFGGSRRLGGSGGFGGSRGFGGLLGRGFGGCGHFRGFFLGRGLGCATGCQQQDAQKQGQDQSKTGGSGHESPPLSEKGK